MRSLPAWQQHEGPYTACLPAGVSQERQQLAGRCSNGRETLLKNQLIRLKSGQGGLCLAGPSDLKTDIYIWERKRKPCVWPSNNSQPVDIVWLQTCTKEPPCLQTGQTAGSPHLGKLVAALVRQPRQSAGGGNPPPACLQDELYTVLAPCVCQEDGGQCVYHHRGHVPSQLARLRLATVRVGAPVVVASCALRPGGLVAASSWRKQNRSLA